MFFMKTANCDSENDCECDCLYYDNQQYYDNQHMCCLCWNALRFVRRIFIMIYNFPKGVKNKTIVPTLVLFNLKREIDRKTEKWAHQAEININLIDRAWIHNVNPCDNVNPEMQPHSYYVYCVNTMCIVYMLIIYLAAIKMADNLFCCLLTTNNEYIIPVQISFKTYINWFINKW